MQHEINFITIMNTIKTIEFTDNPAILGKESKYVTIEVNVDKVIESWRDSIFSYEWLTENGQVKEQSALSEREHQKRAQIEELLTQNKPIPKALLGIGLKDNIEIGIGRAHFLTIAAHNIKEIPVHIPKSNSDDFKAFIA